MGWISRNVAFNENEELRELEIVEVSGVQVEGDIREISPQQPVIPQKLEADQLSEPRQLWKTGFIDYTKFNNPNARVPTWQTQILDWCWTAGIMYLAGTQVGFPQVWVWVQIYLPIENLYPPVPMNCLYIAG